MARARSDALSRSGATDGTRTIRAGSSTIVVTADARDFAARFEEFAEACSRFSREVVQLAAPDSRAGENDNARINMRVAKTIFGMWSIDILTCLYTRDPAGFQEIKKALGKISARVLSLKLARLERLMLVRREVLDSRPPRVQYSLTEDGFRVARLGEPVFLYLRLMQGLLSPREPIPGDLD